MSEVFRVTNDKIHTCENVIIKLFFKFSVFSYSIFQRSMMLKIKSISNIGYYFVCISV